MTNRRRFAASKTQRRQARQRRLLLETLEDRRMLVAGSPISASLAGGVLMLADAGGGDDELTIQADTANNQFLVNSTGGVINSSVPGSTGDGTPNVTIPFAGVASLLIDGGAGDDALTVDESAGAFGVPITFNGGGQSTAAGDSLTITGGSHTNATFNFTGQDSTGPGTGFDGDIDLDGSTIVFTGLEPLANLGTAANIIFNLPNVINPDVVLQNSANAGETELIGSTFENTIFLNPTDSLTINGGTLRDTISVNGVDAAFDADLTIAAQGPDSITVSGATDVDSGEVMFTAGSITSAALLTTTNDVTWTALSSTISDGNGAALNVAGDHLTADGITVSLDTQVTSLDASAVSAFSVVRINEVDAIELDDVDSSAGDVRVTAGGQITATDVEAGGSGNVVLTTTAGDILVDEVLAISNTITVTSAGSIQEIGADPDVDLDARDLTLAASGGIGNLDTIEIDAFGGVGDGLIATSSSGGNINLIDLDNTLRVRNAASTGDVKIDAADGNMNLETVSGTNVVLSAADSIVDGKAGNNVSATTLEIQAFGGSVGDGGNALETSVDQLEGTATDEFVVVNSGGLTIGGFSALSGVSTVNDLVIVATSPITVTEDVSGGDVTLLAVDSAAPGDDVTIGAGVTVQSTITNLNLTAGDDVIVDATATLIAAGALNIDADSGNADAGVGATVSLLGQIDTTLPGTVTGNADADSITLDPAAGSSGVLDLEGVGGDDSFTVQLGNLGGQVNVEGGGGTDDLTIDGVAGADNLSIDGAQTTGGGETITYVDLESLDVNGEDGSDTFTVSPDLSLDIDIFGGDPTSPALPGDTLVYITPPGQTATLVPSGADSGTIQSTGGFADVEFDEIESITFGGAIVINGSADDDLLVVNATSPTSGTFQLTTDVDGSNGGPNVGPIVNFIGATSLTFNSGDDNDVMEINNPAGDVLAPTSGITFNGGAGNDLLQNLGGAAPDSAYTVGPAADEGTVVNGDQTITFTGLEPVQDTVASPTLVITASGGADAINLINGPVVLGDQTLEANFSGAFELIQFANKTDVTIDAGAGADNVLVDYSIASAGLNEVTIDGGSDADTINIESITRPLIVNGEGGDDNVNVSDDPVPANGTLNSIGALITVDGGGGSNTLSLSDGGDPAANAGVLTSSAITGLGMTGGVAYSNVDAINLLLGSGNDTFAVQSLGAGVQLNLDTGDGSDVINLGVGGSLGGLAGDIDLDGNTGSGLGVVNRSIKGDVNSIDFGDRLNINDNADVGSFTYNLSDSTFSRTGIGVLTYTGLEVFALNASIGAADVNVANTAAGADTSITTQGAADDIDVATTGDDSSLMIMTGGGADDVNIANTGTDGGDANAFGAFVIVQASGGADTLTLQNSGASSRVELSGQGGLDTINVQQTGLSSATNLLGGDEIDTFNLGSVGDSLGGILGLVCVEGNAHPATPETTLTIKGDSNTLQSGDILNLNDQGDAGSFTYTVTDTTVDRAGSGTIVYATIETLNLQTAMGAANVDLTVTASSVNTTITTQDAVDDVDITTTGDNSNVVLNTGDGADEIDIATTGNGSFTIVNAGDGDDLIDVQGQGIGSRIGLFGEGGEETFTLTGGGTVLSGVIDGGADDDTLDFSGYAGPIDITLQSLGPIDGFSGIEGDGVTGAINGCFENIDVLIGTSSDDDTLQMGADLPTHWDIIDDDGQIIVSDVSLAGKRTVLPLVPGPGQEDLQWDSFENLVGAETANDRFDLRDGGNLTGSIDGRGGNDSIDYRDFTTSVDVDLGAGTATNIGGGLVVGAGGDPGNSIENAFGGDANDNLVGDEDDNILGDGFGDDNLTGQAGDDTFRLEPNPAGTDSNDNLFDTVGDDTVDFSCAHSAIMIDMDLLDTQMDVMMVAGNQFVTLNSNPTALEFSNFENVIGSPFNEDIFYVDALAKDGDVPTEGPPVARTVNGNTPHGVGDLDRLYFDGQGQVVLQTSLSVSIPGLGTVNHISVGEVIIYNQQPLIIDNGEFGFGIDPDPQDELSRWQPHPPAFGPDAFFGTTLTDKSVNWRANLAPGAYEIFVAYIEDPDLAPDAQYVVSDGQRQIGVGEVDLTGPADSFVYLDAPWESLGVYRTIDGVLDVLLESTPNGRIVADAMMFVPVSNGPEMTVLLGNQLLTDEGVGGEFNTTINVDQTRLVTIRNDGDADLEITQLELITSDPNFVIAPPTLPLLIAPGEAIGFPITLLADTHGEFSADLQIVSNDVDENVLTKPGAGTLPPDFDQDPFLTPLVGRVDFVSIIDDGDPGFQLNGTFRDPDGSGFQGDERWRDAEASGESGTWTFSGLPADLYNVALTWEPEGVDGLPNVQVEVLDGPNLLATLFIDQSVAPGGFMDRGADWQSLGDFLVTPGNDLIVRMVDSTAANNQRIILDAARVERVIETEIVLLDLTGAVPVPDDIGVVDFGDTNPFVPQQRVFRLENQLLPNANPMLVSEPVLPAGFTLTQFDGQPPTGALTALIPPGGFIDFTVEMLAGWPGLVGGQMSIDMVEQTALPQPDFPFNPYDVQLQGQVLGIQIIDDSDPAPAFQTVGAWRGPDGDGFRNTDLRHDDVGSATWTFTGLDPSIFYRVAATWHSGPDWETEPNALFTVNHAGAPSLQPRNQFEGPGDFWEQGVSWSQLGLFQPTPGGQLSVTLTDPNPGNINFVQADAIRVEPLAAPTFFPLFNGLPVQNGDVIDLGQTDLGTPTSQVLRLQNFGQTPMPLGPLELGPGFSFLTPPPPLLPPAVGGVPGFVDIPIQLDALGAGEFQSPLLLLHGDALLPPLELHLQGQVLAPDQIIDNLQPGFVPGPSFQQFNNQGYLNSVHSATFQNTDVATFTFDLGALGLTPGQYQVSLTWSEQSNRDTAVPVRVLDDATEVLATTVDQTLAPNDFNDAGGVWENLGNVVVTSNFLRVEISNNVPRDVIADAVRIQPVSLPEIDVFNGLVPVPHLGGPVAFGSTAVGTPVDVTLTISNTGAVPLTLGAPILPAGYSVVGAAPAAIPAGATAPLTLRLNAGLPGIFNGDVLIPNNDANETPYRFSVTGSASTAGAVIDDNEPGYSTTGFTNMVSYENGFQGDYDFAMPGNGDTATYSYVAPVSGFYQVAASWKERVNNATNSPFEVLLDGGVVDTRTLNQRVAPNDYAFVGVNWERVGVVFANAGQTIGLRTNDAADNIVIADAARFEQVLDPQIQVLDGVQALDSFQSTVDMGVTGQNVPTTRTITVRNFGGAALMLSNDIQLPAGFSLASPLTSTNLAPGAAATFDIQFDALTQGTSGGTVSITSNDGAPFEFEVTAQVVSGGAFIVDNRDPEFVATSGFFSFAFGGFRQFYNYAQGDNSGDTATWTFTGLTPGTYAVATTWDDAANRATDAPFTVFDGTTAGTNLGTLDINQTVAPSSFADEGVFWTELPGTFEITGDTLTVLLEDDADGFVIADAIRIERLVAPEIQITNSSNEVIGDGLGEIDFGAFLTLQQPMQTITITNVGILPMTLNSLPTASGPFTLNPAFAAGAVIPAGGSTTVDITYNAGAVSGVFTGVFTLTDNSDADEDPFTFDLKGETKSKLIIDNRDPFGYTSTSGFSNQSKGFRDRLQWARGDNSGDVATWTFSNQLAGNYRVSATWRAFSWSATDSTFTINGTTSATFDQKVNPAGFADEGVMWEDIAFPFNLGADGDLVVTLTDDANNYVIADAIRVEYLGPLTAASSSDSNAAALTIDQVAPVVESAIRQLSQNNPSAAAKLANVDLFVRDLPGQTLGLAAASSGAIVIDSNAAGHGWSIQTGANPRRMDLLTVVAHELNHLLGAVDLDPRLASNELMTATLPVGVQRFAVDEPLETGSALQSFWRVLDEQFAERFKTESDSTLSSQDSLEAILATPLESREHVDDRVLRLLADQETDVDSLDEFFADLDVDDLEKTAD